MGPGMMVPKELPMPVLGEPTLNSHSVATAHIRMGYRKLHSLHLLSNCVPSQIWQDFSGKYERR